MADANGSPVADESIELEIEEPVAPDRLAPFRDMKARLEALSVNANTKDEVLRDALVLVYGTILEAEGQG